MSTRSRIGIAREDGKVESIYCHWDGYPSNNGMILLEHYTDPEKVKRLVSLGSISSLRENVEPDPVGGKYRDWDEDFNSVNAAIKDANGKHSFDCPQMGVVVAYHRDRGEDWDTVKPRVDDSVAAFVKSDVEEYGYVMVDGKWYVVYSHYYTDKDGEYKTKLVTAELTEDLCEHAESEDGYEPVIVDIPEHKADNPRHIVF